MHYDGKNICLKKKLPNAFKLLLESLKILFFIITEYPNLKLQDVEQKEFNIKCLLFKTTYRTVIP